MAKIPDQLPIDTLQGATLQGGPSSAAGITGTDFGLGHAAQVIGQVQAYDQQENEAKAQPYMLQLQAQNEDAFKQDAAAYTGATPGFASDQIQKAQARAADLINNPDIPQGVRQAIGRLANNEVARVGGQAISHEATVRAQPIVDQQNAQQQVMLNGGLTAYYSSFNTARQQLLDNYDGSQPGLLAAIQQAHDTAAQAALAATPERMQGELQSHLAVLGTQATADAATQEQHGADAFVLKNSQDQAYSLINTVSSNPLAYDSVVNTAIPQIVSTLPAGLRKDTITEFTGLAATARVKGLVDQGQADQAKAELNDGRYDAYLKPKAKEELLASVDSAIRDKAPRSVDQAMAQQDTLHRADLETQSLLATGQSTGMTVGDLSGLSFEHQAQALANWKNANQAHAVAGPIRDMPLAQVSAMAMAPEPQPGGADYAQQHDIWQMQTAVAKDEVKSRMADPAAWAMTPKATVKGAGAAASSIGQDRGAALQGLWAQVQSATHAAAAPGASPALAAQAAQVGARFAQTMIGAQQQSGVPAEGRRLLPQAYAANLAAIYNNAEPGQRTTALQAIAGISAALPPSIALVDGTTAAPQALLRQELTRAGLNPVALSAALDYSGPGSQAALARTVLALNDTAAAKSLSDGDKKTAMVAVRASLSPYLNSVSPLPGADDMAQARIDRTMAVTTYLMATQHMSAQAAAQAAAQDLTGNYQYVDNWRMPLAVARATTVAPMGIDGSVMLMNGAQQARAGAGLAITAALANDGANLFAPATNPGTPAQQRKVFADAIRASGRWVTTQDDSGLALALPTKSGAVAQVQDRYGRPIVLPWSALQAQAGGIAPPLPFTQAPATGPRNADGTPIPAFSKQAAIGAISWAVNKQESDFRSGLVSPKGALGQMQVMPDTVSTYAPRLGLPVDMDRAQHDDAYNRAIGNAALSDHINHFGGSAAGLVLSLASYNAGRGRVEGYTDQAGYHSGWLQTLGDPRTGRVGLDAWIGSLPTETRGYIQHVLPSALGHLQRRGS